MQSPRYLQRVEVLGGHESPPVSISRSVLFQLQRTDGSGFKNIINGSRDRIHKSSPQQIRGDNGAGLDHWVQGSAPAHQSFLSSSLVSPAFLRIKSTTVFASPLWPAPSAAVNRSAINRIIAPSSGSRTLPSAASPSIPPRISAIPPAISPPSPHPIASLTPPPTS